MGDEPASATYPLDRRTAGTINVAGAGVFLYRDPADPGVPVFATNTAGDQVLDLIPEWDYVDGGHLSVPADDFAAGWFAVAYAVEVRAGPSSGGFMVGGGGDPLGHGGVRCLTRWEWRSVQLFHLPLPGPKSRSIPREVST